MTKVSIIIAAYNIENYIERCITSCMNQTYKDIEIIVVNDGSRDSTLEVINRCRKHDERVKVINKENGGLIEARKSGFAIATGEYVLFIDGDDWIDLNAIDILYNKVKDKYYDIVCYKYLLSYEDGTTKKEWDKSINIYENYSLLELLFYGKFTHTVWSKFIKRSFIIQNNIEFPKNISYGEDLAFIYTLAMYNPSFTIIDEYLYFYFKRKGSLDSGVSWKVCEIIQALEFVKEQLKKNNLYDKYREEFDYMAYKQGYYNRKNYIFNNRDDISRKLFNNWKKLKININAKNNKLYRKFYENDSKKTLIVDGICKRSYYLGQLYYKLRV